MGRRARKILRIFAAAVLVVMLALGGVIAYISFTYWEGERAYEDVAAAAGADFLVNVVETYNAFDDSSPESLLANMRLDWDALAAINPDIVGWIYIPGTPINYPVVHSADNDEYLYVNFTGEYANGTQATYGTPFLLAQNSGDFADANNVIQAHNMANGTMFAWIANAALREPSLLADNRTVYLLTPDANYRLLSVSVLICNSNDAVSRTDFSSDEDFEVFASDLMSRSSVDLGAPTIAASDVRRLVSLSTCTSDGTGRRCVLVCSVTEYVNMASGETSGTGDASADKDAAADIGGAASDFS